MIVSIIVAYGNNYEIGKNNTLLWNIPQDLKNFKNLTTNHHIIMGRKTFESIGKPLPNRVSMVLSKSEFEYQGIQVYKSIENALDSCKKNKVKEVFIIGGQTIYNLALPYVNKLYISEVDYEDKNADAFFNKIDFSKWNLIEEDFFDTIKNTNNTIPSWTFKILTKK
jgi:dihydrofolate reductase